MSVNVTLNWTNPTTRTDGSPLAATDIATVLVFDAYNGAAPAQVGNVGNATHWNSPDLSGETGTHVYTVVVQDAEGNQSAASSPVSLNVSTLAPPSPATGLTGSVSQS